MIKKTGNPKVEELTKSHRDRTYNLTNIKKVEKNGLKYCAWCAETEIKRGNQKYCCEECSINAMAWAYPQKEQSLGLLLMKQNFKCNSCNYDYAPMMEQICNDQYRRRIDRLVNFREELVWYFYKRLKYKIEKKFRPEVDHIIPIYKGGDALGIDNHQAICYTCHKTKTSQDLRK